MNRRSFIKSVPAIAAALSFVPVVTKSKPLPSSIMLSWNNRENPEQWGQRTWNISCQRSYDQFTAEAVCLHAVLASRGCYDVEQHDFKTLKFA